MNRITITRRHTGRYYVGLDQDAFFALYGLVLAGNSTRQLLVRSMDRKNDDRVVSAFKAFSAKLKAAVKS